MLSCVYAVSFSFGWRLRVTGPKSEHHVLLLKCHQLGDVTYVCRVGKPKRGTPSSTLLHWAWRSRLTEARSFSVCVLTEQTHLEKVKRATIPADGCVMASAALHNRWVVSVSARFGTSPSHHPKGSGNCLIVICPRGRDSIASELIEEYGGEDSCPGQNESEYSQAA